MRGMFCWCEWLCVVSYCASWKCNTVLDGREDTTLSSERSAETNPNIHTYTYTHSLTQRGWERERRDATVAWSLICKSDTVYISTDERETSSSRSEKRLKFARLSCYRMSILAYNGCAVIAMTGKNCVAIASDLRFGIQQTTQATDFRSVTTTTYTTDCALTTDVSIS